MHVSAHTITAGGMRLRAALARPGQREREPAAISVRGRTLEVGGLYSSREMAERRRNWHGAGAGGHRQRTDRDRFGCAGGTLLTGGVGLVAGTLFGGMIFGLIATLINFNGSLNGARIMIVGGVLLFLFIVLQLIVLQRFLVGSFRLRSVA